MALKELRHDIECLAGFGQVDVVEEGVTESVPHVQVGRHGSMAPVLPAVLVAVVNGLIAKGLLERPPADGRSHELYLTREGGELHRKLVKVSLEHEKYFFGDVPDDLREVLMQAFRSLRANAEQRG